MQHNYEPKTIYKAMVEVSEEYPQIRGMIGAPFEAFLDALPEPTTDDWQECGFNDFLPTDKRVKAVFAGGSIIEGTPDRRSHEHVFLVDGPVIHSYDDATFYRIPKKIVHPDPDEYEVIFVFKTKVRDYMISEGRQLVIWDGCNYVNSEFIIKPDNITDWSPAKVVEDDR